MSELSLSELWRVQGSCRTDLDAELLSAMAGLYASSRDVAERIVPQEILCHREESLQETQSGTDTQIQDDEIRGQET